MDESIRERVETAAEVQALINAVKHEGEAEVGAIMGPLMGDHPEFREYGDEVPGVVAPVVSRVNDLTHAERRDRLEELDPDALAELEATDEGEEHVLPDLPEASDVDEVRMRCAPNPNGPWHIGNTRMPAVIGTYRDRYDGWMLCRFDDTDPETKRPDLDAYDAILDAFTYLGFEPDAVMRASDRLDTYYEYARELIEQGGAYTCSCTGEDFSELKNAGKPCPHRDTSIEIVREEFEDMVAGAYSAGERVLRVRTDIEHKNPAVRDWVAFRQVDTPHPRAAAADYRCWPMLDFQSAIDDALTDITHIIRGIDLQDSAKRQRYLYTYFDWEYPHVIHWGHVQLDAYDVSMSTSTIKSLVEAGDLDGWDDPRAPTVASLERRGIQGAAITAAMIQLGTSTSNVELAMSSIYAANRELVDPTADRYFLVRDPTTFQLVGEPPTTATPPRHPTDESRGTRTIPVGDAVAIESPDIPDHGDRVWLKGLGCVRLERDALVLTGDDIGVVREGGVPVIHWAPAQDSIPVTVHTMDGTIRGIAEPEFETAAVDSVVQFERVGFARVDEHREDRSVTYFAHE